MKARRGGTRGAFGGTAAVTAALLAGLTILTAAPAASAPAASKSKVSPGATVRSVTLAIRHRIFQNFSEVQSVTLQKEFPVGDTDFSARVIRYVPDFAMELKSRKVVSRSNEPKNPAFEIVVREKGVPQDTTWAFLNMPPHFARRSLLAFKIARIDYDGREPILADTTHEASAPPAAAKAVKP